MVLVGYHHNDINMALITLTLEQVKTLKAVEHLARKYLFPSTFSVYNVSIIIMDRCGSFA